ncbi:MAG: GGDEF domain-containing protein [Gammaproteobacteria bacterium]
MTSNQDEQQNINPYSEDFNISGDYLRLTLAALTQKQIPPTPVNYRIGYDAMSGNAKLKSAFDQIINNPEDNKNKSLWNLYQQTYTQDEAAIEIMRQDFMRVLTSVQGEFEKSDGDISTYSESLVQFANILDSATSPEDITVGLNKIVKETQDAEQSQILLKDKLSSAMDEINTLRKELNVAREESLVDTLTEIANRKAFDQEMDELISKSASTDSSFCLILGDIDHFKHFNDTHGHLVGDKVLRFVATTLKRCVKGSDTAARYGGEEFAVLLPQTDINGAHIVAEQIRTAISAGILKNKAGDKNYGTITISMGIAEYSNNDDPSSIIKRADTALYLAKERGRNRVEKAA